jgi:hypothetical protein
MNFSEMVAKVAWRLLDRGEIIKQRFWVNGNRNHLILTDKRQYLLKWNDSLFGRAGQLVKGLGPGVGLTIDNDTEEAYGIPDSHILFTWTATDKIYYQTIENFRELSKPYTQKSGEREKVILVQSLVRWD